MLGPDVPRHSGDGAPNIVKDGTPQKARRRTPAQRAVSSDRGRGRCQARTYDVAPSARCQARTYDVEGATRRQSIPFLLCVSVPLWFGQVLGRSCHSSSSGLRRLWEGGGWVCGGQLSTTPQPGGSGLRAFVVGPSWTHRPRNVSRERQAPTPARRGLRAYTVDKFLAISTSPGRDANRPSLPRLHGISVSIKATNRRVGSHRTYPAECPAIPQQFTQ